jgi:hypothetical protein
MIMDLMHLDHSGYGSGTVISADGHGNATVRFDDPPGRRSDARGGVVPTVRIKINEHHITLDGQTAIMRDCPECAGPTPHKITDTGRVCGICGRETARAQGQAET